jgi:hypothetical protein
MPNDAHDERGRFATKNGSATGDHQTESNANTRRVPGHGVLPRSKVIAKHAGAASVGTSSGGGGGGGGQGGGGRMSAKAERIAMRQQVDQRHKPNRTDSDVASMTAYGQPLGTQTTPGRLDPRQSDFVRGSSFGGAKPRVRVKAR